MKTIKPIGKIWLGVALVIVVFIGANSHLVYVALQSQPECVQHVKVKAQEGGNTMLRAAKPSC